MALSPGKHGIVLIHGIAFAGIRGGTLASVTNSLADSLLESTVTSSGGPAQADVVGREMDLTGDVPSATLHIKSPDGEKATWVFKEAFWADAFSAPSASSVLRWLMRQIAGQLKYIVRGLTSDPANNEDHLPRDEQTSTKTRRKEAGKPDQWKARWWVNLAYRLELLAASIFLLPMAIIAPVLLFILWPLYWIPRFGFLESLLVWLHSLDPFLSRSLGDVKRYIEHGMWSASSRGIVENVIIDMLSDKQDPVEDITIVGESMGAVVAYDTLGEGGKVADAVAAWQAGGQKRRLTLITVGGGLNQVLRLAERSNLFAKTRFRRALDEKITGGYDSVAKPPVGNLKDKFFWLDIYARFDPVPAGDLDQKVIKQAKVHPDLVKRRRVINLDNPIRDHTYYWHNRELVAPRVINAINGGEYPWPEVGITRKKLRRRVNGVATLVALRLGMAAIVLAALVLSGLNVFSTLTLPAPLPLVVGLVAVGVYQSIRSRIFGDIS